MVATVIVRTILGGLFVSLELGVVSNSKQDCFVDAVESCRTQDNRFSDRDITISDDLFTDKELSELQNLLVHEETAWQFSPKEISTFKTDDEPTSSNGNVDIDTYQPYQWQSKLDPETFANGSRWSKIFKTASSHAYEHYNGSNTELLFPYKVNGVVVASGDFVRPVRCKGLSYAVVIFLTKKWKRNWYGELVIYTPDGEILKAVHPRLGRVVMFPCEFTHVIRPPSVGYGLQLKAITVVLNSSEKVSDNQSHNNEENSSVKQEKGPSFPFISLQKVLASGERDELVNVSKYVTRRFVTKDGKPILVLDGVLPQKDVNALTHAVNHASYNYIPPDPDSSDNVQWIAMFEVEDLVQTRLWSDIKLIASYISGEKDCYPYDVGCNNIRKFDNTKIHDDLMYVTDAVGNIVVDPGDEYTFLLYLNSNWTDDFHGETVFFDSKESPNPEIIFAVKPKHGRICIFHGGIPHSARPPSLKFKGARYSFAVKMATSMEKALRKANDMEADILKQALHVVSQSEKQEILEILEKLENNKLNEDELEKAVKKYEKLLAD